MTQAVVVDQIYQEPQPFEADSGVDSLQLVRRVSQGDRFAFEQLVAAYQSGVYGLVYRLLGDSEEAQDVAQETFLRVYQKIGQFRGESSLKTWIYRIAVRQASNHRRWWVRRGRRQTISIDHRWDGETGSFADTLADSRPDCEQAMIRDEQERQLTELLSRLKHAYRVAVTLRDIEGCSYEEIAQIAGVSLGTVKSRIARGREMLRQELIKSQAASNGSLTSSGLNKDTIADGSHGEIFEKQVSNLHCPLSVGQAGAGESSRAASDEERSL